MNHTTLALVAVLAAAALVIGAAASPAFAGGHYKKDKYGDSSKTITKQVIKQKQKVDDNSLGIQNANNCITVLSQAACGQAALGLER